jgi:hypothetical protein
MKNTNRVKAMLRIAGIAALAAAMVFTAASCDDGAESPVVRAPNNSTYTWTEGTSSYRLTITEPDGVGRAVVTDGNFVLVVMNSSGVATLVLTGTSTGGENSFSLKPDGGSAIAVTINGSTITISATVGGVTIRGGSNLQVEPGTAPSVSGDKVRIEDYVIYAAGYTTATNFSYCWEGAVTPLSNAISGTPSVTVNGGKLSISLDAPKQSALNIIGNGFGFPPGVSASDKNARGYVIPYWGNLYDSRRKSYFILFKKRSR